MGACSNKFSDVSPFAFVAIVLFSMSSWLDVVGVWVEMPVLTAVLPEGWNLPSYLAVIIQLANIGPASYAIIRRIREQKLEKTVQREGKIDMDIIVSFVIIFVAGLSVLLMSFYWQVTGYIFGSLRSVALLSLMLFSALSSCTSSVVFLPYMARFATPYISAYYIGQGFSGLIPGLIGLAQGIGEFDCVTTWKEINQTDIDMYNVTFESVVNVSSINSRYREPKFSVSVYFGCLTILFVVSAVSYSALNFTEYGRKAMVKRKSSSNGRDQVKQEEQKREDGSDHSVLMLTTSAVDEETCADTNEKKTACFSNGTDHSAFQRTANGHAKESSNGTANDVHVVAEPSKKSSSLPQSTFITLLIIVAVVNALLNGILPSTQSYTCIPYGSIVYMLALRLSSVAGPIASLMSMLLPRATTKVVIILAVLGTSIGIFHLILASQSPDPILRDQLIGKILVVVSAIVMSASFSYVRVSIAMLLHSKGGRCELLWCGGITQLGSFCGAVVAFIVINWLHVFTKRGACS